MSTLTKTWDYQGEWMNRFPQNTRSTIMNLFCYAVRDGHSSPLAVLQQVEYQALRRKGRYSDSCLTDEWLDELVAALEGDEARAVAEHVIWREGLPPEEKARLKAQSGKAYIAAYMADQPPTEKQLHYLRSLGCREAPQSKKEASEWIDQWLNKKHKASA